MFSKQHFRYYVPALLWAIAIFIGSSIPSQSIPSFVVKVKDLVLHFVEYTIFGLLLGWAFLQSPSRASVKLISLAAITGILYGASDELHQKFVAGRVSSFLDFLADSAGVLFGLLLFVALPKLLSLRHSSAET